MLILVDKAHLSGFPFRSEYDVFYEKKNRKHAIVHDEEKDLVNGQKYLFEAYPTPTTIARLYRNSKLFFLKQEQHLLH